MNVVYLVFLGLAWVGIECFIGGTRLIFSLPAYAVIAIGAILTLASFRRKGAPPDPLCLLSTFLMGGWVLLRSSHSPVEYLAWPDFFMMIACLMTYLLTALYLTGTGVRAALIATLWLVAALEVGIGMIQFAKDPNFMLFGLLRPKEIRASGMYISPNHFAGFLLTVAILSISIGVWSRWRVWAKLLAFYIAACCLAGVAISGSRGGYFSTIGGLLAFAGGSIYVVRIANPRKALPLALAALGGVAAVIAVAAFFMFHSNFLTHRMQTMVSKDPRIFNWEAALDHIRVSPWIGTGAGTHLIYGRLFRRPQIQADPVHAHCDYLELLAEYGILGGACMAFFLTAHLRRGFASFSLILRRRLIPSGLHQSNSFALQLGALCAVAGLAIHSIVDFDMHIPGNALVFSFIFGVLANPDIDQPPARLNLVLIPFAKAILPILGVVMLWRGLPLLPSEYCAEMARRSLRDKSPTDVIRYAQMGLGPGVGLPAASLVTAPPASVSGGQNPDLLNTLLSKTGPDPKNPDLYFYLGEANRLIGAQMINPYMRRLYYGRADAAYKAGLKVFPQDENLLVRDGEALDGSRNFAAAEPIYQQALAWDPNLDILHKYYEFHLAAEGKLAEAEAMARQREQNKPVAVDSDQVSDSPLR